MAGFKVLWFKALPMSAECRKGIAGHQDASETRMETSEDHVMGMTAACSTTQAAVQATGTGDIPTSADAAGHRASSAETLSKLPEDSFQACQTVDIMHGAIFMPVSGLSFSQGLKSRKGKGTT